MTCIIFGSLRMNLAAAFRINCTGLIELAAQREWCPGKRGGNDPNDAVFLLQSAAGVPQGPSCSHLMQTVFSFSHKTVLRDVYRSHLRTQLMPLTLHPIANYTVQSLISASARFKVVRPFSGSLMSLTFALIKLKALKILLLIIILRGDGKTVSPWYGYVKSKLCAKIT